MNPLLPARLGRLALLLFLGLGAFAQEPALVVLRPVVNMHRSPNLDAAVVSQTALGARVLARGHRNAWVEIETDDAYTGWVEAAALRPLRPGEAYPASQALGQVVEVSALSANLYREPDVTAHAPLLQAPFGTRLERVQDGHDPARWLKVRLPDGRLAWIQVGDVRIDLRPLSLLEALALAKRFLGITYTWGGSSTFGFDCSGFTQTIYRQQGVILPRDAHMQAAWPGLKDVSRADLRPGDLLFFGQDAAHITHTGIYLEQGRFIHDTPKDHPGIQISELADPSWSPNLVAVRRLK